MRLGWLARVLLLAAPLAVPAVVPLRLLPPGFAFALSAGRWLVLAGAVAALVSLALPEAIAGTGRRLAAVVEGTRRPWLAVGLFALLLAAAVGLIPGDRWSFATLTGDEPKYLQMAGSLAADLDVDVASETGGPPTRARLGRNLRSLAAATWDALGDLLRGRGEPPPGHHFSLGNWTLAGRDGGRYFVQSPGLPIVLLPASLAQNILLPDRDGPLLPLLLLCGLWSAAAVQTVLLSEEVSGSRTAGVLAGLALACSPAVFVSAYHFYPEAVAAALVPWLLRFGRAGGPACGPARAALLGAACGVLPWLHPKFLPLALALGGLLLLRLWPSGARLAVAALAGSAVLAGLLLFDHHVTGLARPDAFYVRYADELYTGPLSVLSPRLAVGLVAALLGARDGLLTMAPVLAAGLLALPALWRRSRRTTLELALVFGSLWLAAATHGGGAPGPPARLMVPVACLLAAVLAVGLAEWGRRLPYRWTVAALALAGIAVTLAMQDDWRRVVNPWRGWLRTEADLAADLPDGPRSGPTPFKGARDVARGLILFGLLAASSALLSRCCPTGPSLPERWQAIRNVHAAWWTATALGSWALHAVG